MKKNFLNFVFFSFVFLASLNLNNSVAAQSSTESAEQMRDFKKMVFFLVRNDLQKMLGETFEGDMDDLAMRVVEHVFAEDPSFVQSYIFAHQEEVAAEIDGEYKLTTSAVLFTLSSFAFSSILQKISSGMCVYTDSQRSKLEKAITMWEKVKSSSNTGLYYFSNVAWWASTVLQWTSGLYGFYTLWSKKEAVINGIQTVNPKVHVERMKMQQKLIDIIKRLQTNSLSKVPVVKTNNTKIQAVEEILQNI